MHRSIAVVALFLAGCLTREVRATPADLEAARVLLRDGTPVALRTEDKRTEPVQPDQNVEIIDKTGLRFTVNLREILRDCVDHEPEEGRLCELHGVDHVVLAHHREVDRDAIGKAAGTAVALVLVGGVIGAGVCAFECESNWKWPSRGVIGALGLLIVYAISERGFG